MKTWFVVIVTFLALTFTGVAFAERNPGVDMNEYKCSDLMKEKVEDVPFVLLWVDGYISCETEDLYFDKEWIEYLAERIFDDCSGKPDVYLIDIVEEIAAEQ